jgi:hypothetical protein
MLNRDPNSRPDSKYLSEKFECFKKENGRKMMNLNNTDILASCLKITKSEENKLKLSFVNKILLFFFFH